MGKHKDNVWFLEQMQKHEILQFVEWPLGAGSKNHWPPLSYIQLFSRNKHISSLVKKKKKKVPIARFYIANNRLNYIKLQLYAWSAMFFHYITLSIFSEMDIWAIIHWVVATSTG